MTNAAYAEEDYLRAIVGEDGVLKIYTDNGKVIVPTPEPTLQDTGAPVGYDRIKVSADGSAVGWLVLYPNCCTSYPLPLTLVVYSNGVKRSYGGGPAPTWNWRFFDGGRQVGFQEEFPHGGRGIHFELWDIRTDTLISEYSPPVGRNNQPLPNPELPDWAAAIEAL